jgi:RES domain-containing protein
MAKAYHVLKKKWSGNAFDGEGARLFGGRWNSRGTSLVYLSESLPLAILEILVHLDDWDCLLKEYVYFEVEIPDEEVMVAPHRRLPRGWDAEPVAPVSQLYGDAWAAKRKSLALRVPSIVVRPEYNLLLNPLHPAMRQLTKHGSQRVDLDKRLLRARR